MNKKNSNKARLAFDLLQKEMQVMSEQEARETIGGENIPFDFMKFFDYNPSGLYYFVHDSANTYILDNSSTLITTNGERYSRISTDGGLTWINTSYSDFNSTGWNNNYFDSNYIGPNNPEGYDLFPSNRADVYAYYHDIDYDALGASGIEGVMIDMKTLGADIKLICNEAILASGGSSLGSYLDFKSRLEALCVSVGISFGVLIKAMNNSITNSTFVPTSTGGGQLWDESTGSTGGGQLWDESTGSTGNYSTGY